VIAEFMRTVNPAETIVTHDSGSPRDQLVPFYRAVAPRGYIGWGKSHALGTGLGAHHRRQARRAGEILCVNFMGDAAFGMTGLDFETAVCVGAPICTMVFNNSTMAIEIGHMRLSHEKYRTRDIGGNYAAIARALGGWSEQVEDPEEIAGAICRARRATEEGRAALLEFVTGPEQAFSFRRAAAGWSPARTGAD
jgi:acetolactate synthase-1/2/3 large subunit